MGWRSGLGKALKNLSHAAGAALAGVAEAVHDPAAKLSAIGSVALVPPILAASSERLLSGGRLEQALRGVLENLVRELLSPPEALDPRSPTLRVTAFVPRKNAKKVEMVPFLRLTSAEGDEVRRLGEGEFKTAITFAKGDPLVGRSWQAGIETYTSMKSVGDFPGNDTERFAAWSKQWRDFGAHRCGDWSQHMRNVRTVWTFCIPGPDDEEAGDRPCLAILSLDSTEPEAFGKVEVPPNVNEGRPKMFSRISMRDGIAAAVVGMVLTGMFGSRRHALRRVLGSEAG